VVTVDQLTDAERNILAQEDAIYLGVAKAFFKHFLRFVQVPESGVGMVPLQEWPHIAKVVEVLANDLLIVWAKSRQIGCTTILAAYCVWHAQFTPHARVVVFSKGERDAWDFLDKCKEIYSALPDALRIKLESDNREQMVFAGGSKIETMPSTTDAGRGRTPTLVIMDEADYHEYLDACYNSVKPGLDDNGGQLILASTISAYKLGSTFQFFYQSAPGNGFTKLFYGWRSRPNRDDEWYKAQKLTYQDQALFQKEHPETEEEAFAPAKAIAAFDLDVLTMMKQDVKEPIEVRTMGNGVRASIYQEFQPGNRYAAATDTSHGTGKDFAVTVIYNTVTGYVVADIYSSVINPFQLGVASVELLNSYGSPIWAIEDNDWGINTITAAQELRYKRIYHRENGNPGWHTYDSQGHAKGGRYQVWGDLIEAINTRQFTIPNGEGLAQFFTVIRNPAPGKHGRIEAQHGAHDDYPMALAIAYQLREFARPAAGDRGKAPSDFTGNGAGRRTLRWNPW
jgi:hypothetical protein